MPNYSFGPQTAAWKETEIQIERAKEKETILVGQSNLAQFDFELGPKNNRCKLGLPFGISNCLRRNSNVLL